MSKRSAQELSKPQIRFRQVVTCKQMRDIESAAIASGFVTDLELMERAGTAVVNEIRRHWPTPGMATIMCGPGNNGGDGYVVARLLKLSGWCVVVLGMGTKPGTSAAEMRRRWEQLGQVEPLTVDQLRLYYRSDVFVDAIFGMGMNKIPSGELVEVLSHIRYEDVTSARTIAIDAPTGLCLDTGKIIRSRYCRIIEAPVKATVTFQRPKVGHLIGVGPMVCGELVIADIGLAHWCEQRPGMVRPERRIPLPDILLQVMPDGGDPTNIFSRQQGVYDKRQSMAAAQGDRADGWHKYRFGHVVVVAGGAGKGGAARLTARAALRAGAGLVTIAPPTEALSEHCGQPDALMRHAINGKEDLGELLRDDRINVVAIGPGCGVERASELLDALIEPVRENHLYRVIDADALTALAKREINNLGGSWILTPHAGEFARLFPDIWEKLNAPRKGGRRSYSKLDAAREAAERTGAVIVFKGADTVIACDGFAIIHSAYDVPQLATAGSGDVLAGIVAGIGAGQGGGLTGVAHAVCLHAMAARRFGPGLIADDLPDMLPKVFRDLGL